MVTAVGFDLYQNVFGVGANRYTGCKVDQLVRLIVVHRCGKREPVFTALPHVLGLPCFKHGLHLRQAAVCNGVNGGPNCAARAFFDQAALALEDILHGIGLSRRDVGKNECCQEFTYDLEDVGRYYSDYVDLMSHWDVALPDFVLRVQHEDVVENLEAQVRRILSFCGLPFEDACLRYFETERNIRTPSSEQVRQPIFTDGLEQWRHFEPWLAPLKSSLESVPRIADHG